MHIRRTQSDTHTQTHARTHAHTYVHDFSFPFSRPNAALSAAHLSMTAPYERSTSLVSMDEHHLPLPLSPHRCVIRPASPRVTVSGQN